jgi:transcriptional regulator with XRE-family HTH domain
VKAELVMPDPLVAALCQRRQDRGLTQQQLGNIIGVSNGAISRWERGNRLPCTVDLLAMADALDCDIRVVPREAGLPPTGRAPREGTPAKNGPDRE